MKRQPFGKRILAWLLSLAIILSVVPAAWLLTTANAVGSDAGILNAVTDAQTLQKWKDVFDPANLSTEHAGGVWTDKSVVLKKDIADVFGNIPGLEAADNNFLVALSALGANSVIVGQGAMPTDTIFVLDISGSMSSTELSAMVTAANDSIHTLLSANEDSRVGVVLYSTSATVLLPLDRYTPIHKGQNTQTTTDDSVDYIELTSNYIRTARTGQGNNTTYLKNSEGWNVTTSVQLTGGTYIQGGLWKAWQEFEKVTNTASRTPVMVLMSDGAPTFTSNDYNKVPNSYETGSGNDSNDGDAFLTQLTAAYVKEKMAQKYSTVGHTATAYFYTLGLGVTSSANTVSVAEAVLNTDKERTGIETYWNRFLALANAQNKTMSVTVSDGGGFFGGSTENVTVTYDATVTAASREYVNKAFSAADASGLSTAFKGIVSEISLKAGYYVTRLDGASTNNGGYVTFVDEIGTGMEFKELEGVLIGTTLYTGEQLAKAAASGEFGTDGNPTVLGNNLVWSVKERLRIQDANGLTATEIARDLLNKAFAAGQISYNTSTGAYSNYIAWFGDENGNYIGFWDNKDPNAVIPAGAAYANVCYGMLGSTTDSQTAHASDMLYLAIQVSKKITEVGGKKVVEAKTPQTVTFRIPAALLPTVTYQISVEAENGEQITTQTPAKLVYNAAEPIRLVYEVGIHSELTPENIHEFVREGYQAKDPNGNYYLYTNAWNWGENADINNPPTAESEVLQDTGKNAITYAYFEPGEDNEHYYFTEDSLVYVKSGSSYVPYEGDTKPENATYYFRHLVYTATADSSDPSKEVTAAVTEHYEELSSAALLKTQQTDGARTWYVPQGTMHRNMHDHNRNKTDNGGRNYTESFFAVNHQLVDTKVEGDDTHHYEIVYMGNNGRVTYSPAQGFALTKEMVQGETAEGQTFPFTVTVTGDSDGKVTVTRDGVSGVQTLSSGKLELSLAAGETVMVTGMDVGATYTVQENVPEGYKLSGVMAGAGIAVSQNIASGTVEENKIPAVTYTNAIQHYGSLLITKEVTYEKNTLPANANTKTFPVKLTLAGMGGQKVYVDGVSVTLDANGSYTFTIIDEQAVNVSGIPEGTAYVVEELLNDGTVVPQGFAADSGYTATAYRFTGTIVKDRLQTAAIKNRYEPAIVVLTDEEPQITIQVNKQLEGTFSNWSFDFVLKEYIGGSWVEVEIGGNKVVATATEAAPNPTISLKGLTFDAVGVYYFRVEEVIPENQTLGMIYDRTFHDFKVTVVDTLSGQLKIQSVELVQHAVVDAPTDPDNDGVAQKWNVTTSFNNKFVADSTKLTIQANKTLINTTTGSEVKMVLEDGQFSFTLYSADSNFGNLTELETTKNGVAGQIIFTPIVYNYTENGAEKTYYYVVKEDPYNVGGYSVDETEYQIQVTVKQVAAGTGSALEITEVKVQGNTVTLPASNVLNGNTISFKNEYKADTAKVVIGGTKYVQNETPGASSVVMNPEDGLFTFTLTGLSGAPMPTVASATNADGKFAFPEITYDTVGNYHYTVTEEAPTAPGYQKDATVHNITVRVTDNGQGKLLATVLYDGRESATGAAFTNTYKAEAVTDVVIRGSKTLNVDAAKFTRTLKAGDFSFVLTRPDGTTETVTNAANGDFSFSALRFDTIGTYTYVVQELGAGTVKNGITYDSASYRATVSVTDENKDGKLEAAVTYEKVTVQGSESAAQADFVNSYTAAPVPVQLSAHKYLTGIRDLEENEFRFTMTKPGGATEQKWNAEDGTVLFDTITYDAVGTYTYTIVEDMVDKNGQPLTSQNGTYIHNGVHYSQVTYTVTVEVVDNGFGALVAHVTSKDNHNNEIPVQFFNRYETESVTVNLTGENGKLGIKTLEDKTSAENNKKDLSDFDFRFVLTDAAGTELETVSDNDLNGFRFSEITFTQPGETVYYIYELNTQVAEITYDTAVYEVTVTVTDDGVGHLKAELSYKKLTTAPDGTPSSTAVNEIAFANTYEAKKTQVIFAGEKTFLGGRDLKNAEFSFVLKDAQGVELETVKNDASGKFSFTAMEYTKEGTYVYSLSEIAGSDSKVTYDETIYKLTVTVVDVAGELVATTQITANGAPSQEYGFTNVFTPENIGTTITVKKVLVNNTDQVLGLDGFTFNLHCVEKNKTDSLVTGTDGLVEFDLLFTSEDIGKTYTYRLSEKKGDMEGMIYSNVTYEIKVAVSQNAETGELVLTVTRDGKTATEPAAFTNVLNKVTDPDDVPPKTDDSTVLGDWSLLISICAFAALVILIVDRKRLIHR